MLDSAVDAIIVYGSGTAVELNGAAERTFKRARNQTVNSRGVRGQCRAPNRSRPTDNGSTPVQLPEAVKRRRGGAHSSLYPGTAHRPHGRRCGGPDPLEHGRASRMHLREAFGQWRSATSFSDNGGGAAA